MPERPSITPMYILLGVALIPNTWCGCRLVFLCTTSVCHRHPGLDHGLRLRPNMGPEILPYVSLPAFVFFRGWLFFLDLNDYGELLDWKWGGGAGGSSFFLCRGRAGSRTYE